MAKRVQDTKPARSAEAKAWVQENILEQKKRHAAIQKEMNVDLEELPVPALPLGRQVDVHFLLDRRVAFPLLQDVLLDPGLRLGRTRRLRVLYPFRHSGVLHRLF